MLGEASHLNARFYTECLNKNWSWQCCPPPQKKKKKKNINWKCSYVRMAEGLIILSYDIQTLEIIYA